MEISVEANDEEKSKENAENFAENSIEVENGTGNTEKLRKG